MEAGLLRVEDVRRYLNFSRSGTYKLLADGALPHVRVGRSIRVPAAALERWVAARTVGISAEGLVSPSPVATGQ